MTERIFNLYLFIQSGLTQSGIIWELGSRVYERSGTDSDKITFLQKQAEVDLAEAQRFPVPAQYVLVAINSDKTQTGLDYRGYEKLVQAGRHLEVFEEVFQGDGRSRRSLDLHHARRRRQHPIRRFSRPVTAALSGFFLALGP